MGMLFQYRASLVSKCDGIGIIIVVTFDWFTAILNILIVLKIVVLQ